MLLPSGFSPEAIVQQLSLRNSLQGEWVLDPHVHVALSLDRSILACAFGNEVLVQTNVNFESTSRFTTGRPDSVTAITWFSSLDRPEGPLWTPDSTRHSSKHQACLVLGTSEGYVQLHTQQGRPFYRQRMHNGPVQNLQLRSWRMGTGTEPAYEDLLVVFSDMLIRVAAAELQASVELCLEPGSSQDVPPLSFQKWQMPKPCGPRRAALCLGVQTRDLYHVLQEAHAERAAKLHIITGGTAPSLSHFEALEPGQRSTLGYIADVASNLTTGVFALARTAQAEVSRRQTALTSGLRSFLAQSVFGLEADHRTAAVVSHDTSYMTNVAETPQSWRAVPEDGRTITALLPAPRGCLVAATDSLGRVLLLDGRSLAVTRMWKGYRDCQCAWLEMWEPVNPLDPQQQRAVHAVDHAAPSPGQQTLLLLAVYAPRRQVVDIWRCPQGSKMASIDVPGHCRLLQCPILLGTLPKFCSSPEDCGQHAPWMANCCILEGVTGRLVSVAEALSQAIKAEGAG